MEYICMYEIVSLRDRMKTCVPVKEGGIGRLARQEPDVFTRDQGTFSFGGLNTAITVVDMYNIGHKVRTLNFDERIPIVAPLPGQ